jgi:hypothetical protein
MNTDQNIFMIVVWSKLVLAAIDSYPPSSDSSVFICGFWFASLRLCVSAVYFTT